MGKIVPLAPNTQAFRDALESESAAYKINRDDSLEWECFKIGFAAGWVASKLHTITVLNNISKDDQS